MHPTGMLWDPRPQRPAVRCAVARRSSNCQLRVRATPAGALAQLSGRGESPHGAAERTSVTVRCTRPTASNKQALVMDLSVIFDQCKLAQVTHKKHGGAAVRLNGAQHGPPNALPAREGNEDSHLS